MKRRLALAITLVVAIGAVALIGIVVRDAGEMAFSDRARGDIGRLAVFVEVYKAEQGNYPTALADLSHERLLAGNAALGPLLSGRMGIRYTYQLSSNGFSITAIKAGTWHSGERKLAEKTYKFGDALNSH